MTITEFRTKVNGDVFQLRSQAYLLPDKETSLKKQEFLQAINHLQNVLDSIVAEDLEEDIVTYDDNWDEVPEDVKKVIESFDENSSNGYTECARVIGELEKIGWTADYGLGAELFDLRRL